jgi:hypothetical protein
MVPNFQQLAEKGTKMTSVPPGAPGYKEMVNFGEHIGYDVNPRTGEKLSTTWGIIHYAKDGTHIVPARPKEVIMDDFSIECALVAMQRALLREVTPELRAVCIDLDKEQEVLFAYFYYDGEASEERVDLWDCAVTEVWAALGPDCSVESKIERWDFPKKIPMKSYCAYLRKEDHSIDQEVLFPRLKITGKEVGFALLPVQHALLGVVTPELRAVVVDVDEEKSELYIRFYHDKEVSKEIIDLWQGAMLEASKDFGLEYALDGRVERVDYPAACPFRGRLAYNRKEQPCDSLHPDKLTVHQDSNALRRCFNKLASSLQRLLFKNS